MNGNRELVAALGVEEGPTNAGGLGACVRGGQVRVTDAGAFLLVTAASRWVAAVRRLRRDQRWGTDLTSRVAA